MRPIYLFKPTEADRAAEHLQGLPYGLRLRIVTKPNHESGKAYAKTLDGRLIGLVSWASLEVLR